jgi:hypothetical protein
MSRSKERKKKGEKGGWELKREVSKPDGSNNIRLLHSA